MLPKFDSTMYAAPYTTTDHSIVMECSKVGGGNERHCWVCESRSATRHVSLRDYVFINAFTQANVSPSLRAY